MLFVIIIKERFLREDTRNWIALADYDMETARLMFAAGRFLYVIFLCHLTLEKVLKAHVSEVLQSSPVKTHDLIYLLKKSGLKLPQESGSYRKDKFRQCTYPLS